MKRLLLSALVAITACTPGGMTPNLGNAGGAGVTTIDVNLTQHVDGYLPDTVTVSVGSVIRFHNSDGFAHTATVIPGATTFPSGSPFTVAAQTQSGTEISQPWTTGVLQAGSSSQMISVNAPGTYLFGCFFHYGAPMRGMIVAH